MSALEAGYAKRGTAPQYTARFGALSEQEIDVNGTRKVVLVVNNTFASNAAQDAYANWFVRWCHLQETASNYAVERRADEMTPLIDMESPETPLYLDEVMASSQGHTDEIYPLAAEGFAGAQQDLDEFTTSHRSLLDE
ncbi:hypothetical protein BDV26DRAFT_261883 [Aspergillus bertholletiae]|uniref:Uncharacterized protein n=1 Tax=Aspergillus bertholletiae TaxID=1226010 RepID=A0A5N7B969_9EURO|nr:hypothetical protein BDV26DRAFT_261883 [Aspergillus bertholletiae]